MSYGWGHRPSFARALFFAVSVGPAGGAQRPAPRRRAYCSNACGVHRCTTKKKHTQRCRCAAGQPDASAIAHSGNAAATGAQRPLVKTSKHGFAILLCFNTASASMVPPSIAHKGPAPTGPTWVLYAVGYYIIGAPKRKQEQLAT